MTFSVQKVKGQHPSDIMMMGKTNFLAIVQHHNSRTKEEIVNIFKIWSEAELVALILAAYLKL